MSYSEISAHNFLLDKSKKFPQANELLKKNGAIKVNTYTGISLFEFICRTVVGQQLSKKAAECIWKRIKNLAFENEFDLFDLFLAKHTTSIQNCGLSKNKTKCLLLLRDSFNNGLFNENQIKSSSLDDIYKILTKQWGIGMWTVDMVAIFYLNNLNIWPQGDSALIKGARLIFNTESEESLLKIIDLFTPYKTLIALHIWKGIDENNI